jgi:endoglucanase
MSKFLGVKGTNFIHDNVPVRLRGTSLGNWLLLENFMIGLPGTDSQIHAEIEKAYGPEKARYFWKRYRECIAGEKDIEYLKGLGVNSIRFPLNYRLFESDQDPYHYLDEGFDEIDRVLKYCEFYGIYVILDLHAAPGGQNSDWHSDNSTGESLFWEHAGFRKRMTALWGVIAERYRDNPWIAGYDLLNESVAPESKLDIFNSFYQECAETIRKFDNNHIIFAEGNTYARFLKVLKPLSDQNCAYSFHFYPMFGYRETKPQDRCRNLKKYILADLSVEEYWAVFNRPLWCGETGCIRDIFTKKKTDQLNQATIEALEEQGISWSLWAYKDVGRMGMLYPKTDSDWMKLSRNLEEKWDILNHQNRMDQYSIKMAERWKIELAQPLLQKLYSRHTADTSYVISTRISRALKEIPFEDFIKYPESFLFENCEKWEGAEDLFKGKK